MLSPRRSLISFLPIFLFFILTFILPSRAASSLVTTGNPINALENVHDGSSNALLAPRSYTSTHTTTKNITRTRIISFNLFTNNNNNAASYQVSSTSQSHSSTTIIQKLSNGITTSIETAKFARKVLGASGVWLYGGLKWEFSFIGINLPELPDWDDLAATVQVVQELWIKGMWGNLELVVELASGVLVFIFFGIPPDEWAGRGRGP
ncbi:MAG: hypothetical protein Q9169_002134 [Polycauliona sp. 2 TL-2023]